MGKVTTLSARDRARHAVRRSVLSKICNAWFDGNKSALADAVGSTQGYVNLVLSGKKGMGEKSAENICGRLEIPQGSLDTPFHGPLGPRESKPFEARRQMELDDTELQLALDWRQMPEPLRTDVKKMIENNTARRSPSKGQKDDEETLQ